MARKPPILRRLRVAAGSALRDCGAGARLLAGSPAVADPATGRASPAPSRCRALAAWLLTPAAAAADARRRRLRQMDRRSLAAGAEAKGVSRKTFDAATKGCATTRKSPPIPKLRPSSRSRSGPISPAPSFRRGCRRGASNTRPCATSLAQGQATYGVDAGAILGRLGRRDRVRRLLRRRERAQRARDAGLHPLPGRSRPRRTDRRHAHRPGRRRAAGGDARLLGGRDGPAAVHAVELSRSTPSISTATANATSGAARPTRSAPSPISSPSTAGRGTCRGRSRSRCPPTTNTSPAISTGAATFDGFRQEGRARGRRERAAQGRARRGCSCRPGRTGRSCWRRTIST